MAHVVGVVFQGGNKTYHFDPVDLELSRGDRVVVQTQRGTEIGQVVEPPHEVEDSDLQAPLKKVTRLATDEDLATQAGNQELRKKAMSVCREMIASHGLDMKLVDADVSFGGEKITFSFYSDDRVDFRALVADLARELKMRIELRQIGAREEARMIGGLGPCGRDLCCTLFSGDEDPVSIRMAKEQSLPLNPMKISGLCGRLMCCLKYEQQQYVDFRKSAPAKGTPVLSEGMQGCVCGYNMVKDAVSVRFEDGKLSEVRLCNCERNEDGCLVCTVEEPVAADVPALEAVPFYAASLSSRSATPSEGEDASEESREQVEGGAESGDSRSSSRSRRNRGRRGRGRGGQNGETDSGEGEARPSTEGAGVQQPGQPGAERTGGQRRRRRRGGGGGQSGQPGGAQEGGAQSQPRPPGADGGGDIAGASGEGSASKRRRRRPRRRGGSGGNGGGEGGAPAAGGE